MTSTRRAMEQKGADVGEKEEGRPSSSRLVLLATAQAQSQRQIDAITGKGTKRCENKKIEGRGKATLEYVDSLKTS